MNRIQKILVGFIAIEAAVIVLAWHGHERKTVLPPVDWKACLIDDAVAGQIRGLENRLDRGNAAQWEELGATYRTFGLFPQAERCYREVDKLGPADRGYLYFWAETFSLMGKTEEATKIYRRIIDEKLESPLGDKTVAYCWLNIGRDSLREENVPDAIEALQKAGDISLAKFLLSRVLIRSGHAPEAIVLLDELLAKSPGMLDYNQMKSWAEAELGNRDAAQEFYDRSLRSPQTLNKMDPVYDRALKRRKAMGSQAWFEQAQQLEAQGNLTEALALTHQALSTFWVEDRAAKEAILEGRTGHLKEAIALAKDCEERVGVSASTRDIVGLASAQLGDAETARRAWEDAAELDAAPRYYRELASITPDPDQKRKWQGLEEYAIGKDAWLTNGLAAAQEHLEKSVALFEGYAHSWFYLGETRRDLGDATGAESAYRRCLAINPDDGRALRGLDLAQRRR